MGVESLASENIKNRLLMQVEKLPFVADLWQIKPI